MGVWGPLVKRSVCRCRCVQVCTDTGAGMYVCAAAGVRGHRCVQMCVQVRCVWARARAVYKRSCSCLPLQSSLASSLWGVWFLHLSS